jgi:hypothetical protein
LAVLFALPRASIEVKIKMKFQSTTMLLIVAGIGLSQASVATSFGGFPLWELLLALGLGSWFIYNGSNIIRLLG